MLDDAAAPARDGHELGVEDVLEGDVGEVLLGSGDALEATDAMRRDADLGLAVTAPAPCWACLRAAWCTASKICS